MLRKKKLDRVTEGEELGSKRVLFDFAGENHDDKQLDRVELFEGSATQSIEQGMEEIGDEEGKVWTGDFTKYALVRYGFSDSQVQLGLFLQSIKYGPMEPCLCCHRTGLKTNMLKLQVLADKVGEETIQNLHRHAPVGHPHNEMLCRTCFRYLKLGKVPAISVENGLLLDPVPPELDLTDLEQQLIARDLLFMTITKLIKTGMPKIKRKVVLVPMEEQDVSTTLTALPREVDESELVFVEFKRMQGMKHAYNAAFIRAEAPVKAVRKLIELGNPFYLGLKENPKYLLSISHLEKREDELLEDVPVPELLCPVEDEFQSQDSNEGDQEEPRYMDVTCMLPMHPEMAFLMNKTTEPVKKQVREDKSVILAPGEAKHPTNWLAHRNFDVRAFPRHHPTGKFGIDHERDNKISSTQYFNQRLLNVDTRFSRDVIYLFAAQQRLEREQIEKQFNIVAQRGTVARKADGSILVSNSDNFAAFQQVRGSPKYWQKARLELLAKVSQLGPFHLFFTLSCGEMRWPEVLAAALIADGVQDVEVLVQSSDKEFKGYQATVGGEPMEQYFERRGLNKNRLLQKNLLLVTRMFDHRVKQFVKLMLLSGKVIPVQYYSYRVEFQLRGMAHVHGVLWLEDDVWCKKLNSGDCSDEILCSEIDTYISCDAGEKGSLPRAVQKHKHTKSCQKQGKACRFGYPRFPSDETLIARPLKGVMTENQDSTLENHKAVLDKVKVIWRNRIWTRHCQYMTCSMRQASCLMTIRLP